MLVAILGLMTLGPVASARIDIDGREMDGEKPLGRSKELWDAWSELLIEVVSEELGIPARDLWAELKAGATIADIADAQGVDQQALYDAYIVRLTEWLDQAVVEGTISQADADGMLTRVRGCGVDLLNKW